MSTKKIQILGSLGNNVELDNTLTESGKAADAKAVGDSLKSKINNSGWGANKYLGTDENGNIVEKSIVSAKITGEVLTFNAVATASVDDEKLIL